MRHVFSGHDKQITAAADVSEKSEGAGAGLMEEGKWHGMVVGQKVSVASYPNKVVAHGNWVKAESSGASPVSAPSRERCHTTRMDVRQTEVSMSRHLMFPQHPQAYGPDKPQR
jgi:hypothetical protein